MGIPTIENGTFPWAPTIEAMLNYVTPGQGDGITTFGDARARLNAAATALGLPTIGNDTTAQIRAKINAMIEGTGVPAEADLYMDFLNGRYHGSSAPTDTHATDILALSSTGYETFGPNVLPRTDLGLLTTVGRTNKCENWNANPVDLTGLSGGHLGICSVVDDTAALASSGLFDALLSDGRMSGNVYKADNSSGGSTAFILVSGSTGNLSTHTVTIYAREETGSSFQLKIGGVGQSADFTGDTYAQRVYTATPAGTGDTLQVRVPAGAVVYFILNQLEEGPFATDPIITEGSAVTRPGNQPVIDLTGRLDEGVAGVIAVDVLQPSVSGEFPQIVSINDGTGSNRVSLYHTSGNLGLLVDSGGARQATLHLGSWSQGRQLVAFAVTTDFVMARRVGDAAPAADTMATYPDLSHLGLGGTGYGTGSNTYQRTERLALQFGPQDQASFDAMYALAQEWAS